MVVHEEQLYEEAVQMSGGVSLDLIEGFLQREQLRRPIEAIGDKLMHLNERGLGSQHLQLRILGILEMLRARDIGKQISRIAPLPDEWRRPWGSVWNEVERKIFYTRRQKGSGRQLRNLRAVSSLKPQRKFNLPPDAVKLPQWRSFDGGQDRLDYSNVLTIHLGYIGDDLIVAVDSNLETFLYGPKDKDVQKIIDRHFSDYGYYPDQLDPQGVILSPVRIKGARKLIANCVSVLHDEKYELSVSTLVETMRQIESAIHYGKLRSSIEIWAKEHSVPLEEICVVFLPSEDLFLLPLTFIGLGNGQPLLQHIGGVSIGLSLLCLKWEIYKLHWYAGPHLTQGSPKFACFFADLSEELDLTAEIEALVSCASPIFKVACFPDASRSDFFANHSAGDVCWFGGHGEFVASSIRSSSGTIQFPVAGPQFTDGGVTNLDLLTTSNWNFGTVWLTVMNCCVLGKTTLIGPNPLGFVTAYHNTGGIAIIAPIFPIKDHVSIDFARILTSEIQENYGKAQFPRARAFRAAITGALDIGGNIWDYLPYTLWGLP